MNYKMKISNIAIILIYIIILLFSLQSVVFAATTFNGTKAFNAYEDHANASFYGYYIGQNGSGDKVISGDGYLTGAVDNKYFRENEIIYAKWGEGTVTLPSPTRRGCTLKGWSDIPDATDASYLPGQTLTVVNDRTLYVVWEYNSYTVTLSSGTGITSVSGAGTYRYGDTVTVTATINSNYTESGWTNNVKSVGNIRYKKTHTYSFANWTGSSTSTSQTYTFTMPAGDVTLTANGQDTEGQVNRQRYTQHTTNPIYVRVWGDYLNWSGYMYKIDYKDEVQNNNYCSLTNWPASGPYGVCCIDIYAGTGRSVSYGFSSNGGASWDLGSGTVSDNHNAGIDYDKYSWDNI